MDQNKKKNREKIERAEKQQRDHFRYKAHKKPEKTIKRDRIVYSTLW